MTYAVTLALLAFALRVQGSACTVQACVHIQYPLLYTLVHQRTRTYQRIAMWRAPPCTKHEQHCWFTKYTTTALTLQMRAQQHTTGSQSILWHVYLQCEHT
jgi:hypothetical protein